MPEAHETAPDHLLAQDAAGDDPAGDGPAVDGPAGGDACAGDVVARDAEVTADSRSVTGYGIGSAVLGMLCVGAVVLIALIWSGHRSENNELAHRTDVMQAAATWTDVLINMNSTNIGESLQTLHEGTVGQLNADFDAAVAPYQDVVKTLQSRTSGRIEAVAIESLHNNLDVAPGAAPPPPQQGLSPGMATRTDTVLVVATSVSENVGGEPQTVRWNLRLEVSEVAGRLLISRLGSLR